MMSDPATIESLELVRLAQRGELSAFDRLFERYYPRVQAIVRVRLGRGLRARMESGDVLHDALVEAFRKFDRFEVRDEASLLNWLASIVESSIRMAARGGRAIKRERAREVALEHVLKSHASGALRFEPSASEAGPLTDAVRGEDQALLEARLGALDEAQREVILLRTYAGASWERVAELSGAPSPDAARMQYARALVALRAALGRGLD